MASGPLASAGATADLFPPLTIGFEFEFLIIWRFDSALEGPVEIPVAGDYAIMNGYVVVNRSSLPPVRGGRTVALSKAQGERVARRAVYELLQANNVDIIDPNSPYNPPYVETHRNAANTRRPEYLRWDIHDDGSVLNFGRGEWSYDRAEIGAGTFYLLDVELVSPALRADAMDNDAEISRVLGLIKDNLMYFVPPSCGLHVHVGQGRTIFDTAHLSKIAAVFYAIDVWFKDLHPQHRLEDDAFSPSTRRRSRLAEGETAAEANARATTWPAPPAVDAAFGNPPELTTPTKAWQELSQASNPAAVCRLMGSKVRGTYNFSNVANLNKPTIEFRQAAGSLNGDWAINWAKLLVGLVDWARQASTMDIYTFLMEAETREASPGLNYYPLDKFVRRRLRLPDVADYIARTSPDTRATPKLTGTQAAWRESVVAPGLGPTMLPRPDWP
ncbi:putative Amidoligase enzyme [Seiridium unicorne]|uniref:Amidoligase enzyme n=1 Tax=Seiridium unicorne TaxID=138068 RepID=A0ABR2UL82_9PEZI